MTQFFWSETPLSPTLVAGLRKRPRRGWAVVGAAGCVSLVGSSWQAQGDREARSQAHSSGRGHRQIVLPPPFREVCDGFYTGRRSFVHHVVVVVFGLKKLLVGSSSQCWVFCLFVLCFPSFPAGAFWISAFPNGKSKERPSNWEEASVHIRRSTSRWSPPGTSVAPHGPF